MGFVISKKVKYYFYNEKGSQTIITDKDIKILEGALKNIDGVLDLQLKLGKAYITYNPLKTESKVFEDIFEGLGYRITYKDLSVDY